MKEQKVCDCPGPCGVGRTHEQIWQDFEAKHRSTQGLDHWDLVRIDRKWRELGKLAQGNAIKNITGV